MRLISKIISAFLNIFRGWWRKRIEKKLNSYLQYLQDGFQDLPDNVADEAAEEFLKLLLKCMSLAFKLDNNYHRNIDGFKAKYQFRSKDASVDKSIVVIASFNGKNMKVKEKRAPVPDEEVDISVYFKNGKAIINYLLQSDSRDILRPVLNNEVLLKGNVNYLLKFGYMANHLQLALTGKLPY